jgi:CheY-like chemotaxis protein
MAETRILIVDDDPWILRMVSTLLEKRGYVILTAGDGEEGILRADTFRPDLIITDVMMPRMDGWALVRALRSRPEFAFVPVIFLTALGGEDDRIRGFRLGADDYLPKPFRFEELELRVGNALKKHRTAKEKVQEVVAAKPPPPPPPGAPVKKPVGIHGTLEQLGLSSLLVMIEMERKSGILRLERSGATGRIFARDGKVIAARLEPAPSGAGRGAEAVYHMLTWAEGRFDFSAVEVEMDDEVKSTTTHLLMEGARLIDEGKR